MTWLQVLFDFLRQFWPFEIVYSYQRAVRFWNGVDQKELGPGLYMFVPFFGQIHVVDVAPDVLKLFDQNLTTKDDVGVMVAANVCYQIKDARKAVVNVQQLENNLGDAFRRHLAKRTREKTWAELVVGQDALEKSCRGTLTTFVKDWGVEVSDVGFVCFIRTKNFSLTNL